MKAFFVVAGATVTVLGILAIAAIFCVCIYVRVLGYPLTLRYVKTTKNTHNGNTR